MRSISTYCSRLFIAGLFFLKVIPVFSEESIMYIPVAAYDYIALESRSLESPSLGAIILGENFLLSALYKQSTFSEEAPHDLAEDFHSIDTMLEVHTGRHQLLGCFKTESDQPVSGGWATLQATAIYNYQIIKSDEFVFRLGAGASLGDFGIDMKDGGNWPLIPVPFLGIEYNAPVLNAQFDFVTGPHLSVMLFPQSRVRLSGEAEINNYRDLQDLLFTAAVHYRFFPGEDSANDFAGVSAGISNNNLGFTPGGSDESYEFQYYSLYTELDLSLLKITGGYAFNGQEHPGDGSVSKTGDGYFISLQAMYQF